MDVIQSTRDACTVQPKLARKKNISVPAGKSLFHDEVLMSGPTGNDKQPTEQHSAKEYSQPGCSKTEKIKTHKKTKQNQDSEEFVSHSYFCTAMYKEFNTYIENTTTFLKI